MFVFYGLPPLQYNLAAVRLSEATSPLSSTSYCHRFSLLLWRCHRFATRFICPTHTHTHIYILNSNFHSKPRLLLPSIKAARPFHSSSVQENWPHHRQQHHLCIFESFVSAVWLLFQRHGICYVIWSIHSSLQSTSHQYLYPWFAICPCHTTTWFGFIHF